MPPILDTAIGTVFVFLLFSLVVSALNELILSKFDQRAKFLHMGLQEIFGEITADQAWRKGVRWQLANWRANGGGVKQLGVSLWRALTWRLSGGLVDKVSLGPRTATFYKHGLINSLSRSDGAPAADGSVPSYIPAGAFVTALLDIISDPPPAAAASPRPSPPPVKDIVSRVIAFLKPLVEPKAADAALDAADQQLAAKTKVQLQQSAETLQQTAIYTGNNQNATDWASMITYAAGDAAKLLEVAKQLEGALVLPADKVRTPANIWSWIDHNIPEGEMLRQSLRALFVSVDGDVKKFETAVEGWFNASMDRVTGWYKRFAQKWMIAIGLAIAVALNVDTIRIVQVLSANPNLAKAVASEAETYASTAQRPLSADDATKAREAAAVALRETQQSLAAAQAKGDAAEIERARKSLDAAEAVNDAEGNFHAAVARLSETGIPFGWSEKVLGELDLKGKTITLAGLRRDLGDKEAWRTHLTAFNDWLSAHFGLLVQMCGGWFLTALAASLGAPFWFDTLGRFVNIRNAGRPPGEKDPTSTATRPPPATMDKPPTP
jgi:hypothetical protein